MSVLLRSCLLASGGVCVFWHRMMLLVHLCWSSALVLCLHAPAVLCEKLYCFYCPQTSFKTAAAGTFCPSVGRRRSASPPRAASDTLRCSSPKAASLEELCALQQSDNPWEQLQLLPAATVLTVTPASAGALGPGLLAATAIAVLCWG